MLKLQQKKVQRPRRLNLEVERWAFGDYDNYGDISMLDIAEQEKPGEITSIKKSPKGQQEGNNENNKEDGENKAAKRPSTGLLKRGNNAMSRQVPGTLQKNITTERKFFKDILQLSQQRFVNLHSLEFQKKAFINKQAIKGIYRVEQPAKRPLASSMSMNSGYSMNQSLATMNNDTTSLLTIDMPPITPRIRSESVHELKTPNMNRRQSLNLTSARKLNLELARMHTIDLIELEEKRKKSSKKRPSVNDPAISEATEAVVLQEIKEINNPEATKPAPVAAATEPVNQAIPQIKSKTIKIIEEPKVKVDSLKKRFTVTDDSRYQSLLVTMTNVYRPTTAKHNANENPNERILRLYRSNTVLMKDNCHILALQEQEKRNRNTFEENFQQFERMVSNII